MLPDVFIPVREARREPDILRYTLRSIAECIPHRNVWVVGFAPSWLSDEVRTIVTTQDGKKFDNIGKNLLAFLAHPEPADDVLFYNDDMICLEPIESVPLMATGTVDRRCDGLRVICNPNHDAFVEGMLSQREILRAEGYDTSVTPCYDGHFPLQLDRAALLRRVVQVQGDHPKHPVGHFKMLTVPLLAGQITMYVTDPKIKGLDTSIPEGRLWVSTYAQSWRGRVGYQIRARFPNPCRYERIET